MTQNTEQNVRTREEQVFQFGNDLIDLRGRKPCTEYSIAKRHILEAEARGAAEAVLKMAFSTEQQAIEERKAGKRGEAFWRIVLTTALHEPEEYSRDEAQSCIDRIFREVKSIGAAEVRAALEKLLKALSCTGNAEDPDVLIAEREARELLDKLNTEVKG